MRHLLHQLTVANSNWFTLPCKNLWWNYGDNACERLLLKSSCWSICRQVDTYVFMLCSSRNFYKNFFVYSTHSNSHRNKSSDIIWHRLANLNCALKHRKKCFPKLEQPAFKFVWSLIYIVHTYIYQLVCVWQLIWFFLKKKKHTNCAVRRSISNIY